MHKRTLVFAVLLVLGAAFVAHSARVIASESSVASSADSASSSAASSVDSASSSAASSADSASSSSADSSLSGSSSDGSLSGSSSDSSHSGSESESESSHSHSEESAQPDEETAARTVKELTGPKGGKVTIIANKNTLTHVQAEEHAQDFVYLEEQEQKRSDEQNEKKKKDDDLKAKTEDDAKAIERNRIKKEKEQEEAKKAKEKEEQDKRIKEEGDKKILEQNTKESQQKAEQEKKNEERKKEEGAKQEQTDKKNAEEADKKKAEEAEKKKKEDEEADKKKKEEEEKRQRVRLEGWSNYENSYENNVVVKWNRFVFVEGLIRGNNGYIGILPDDCRPYDGRLIFGLMKGNYNGRVDVLQDGRIYWITAGDSDWLSLNGISFDTNLNNGLELIWGWQSYGYGYRQVTQSKQDDLCMISGLIRSGSWNYLGRVADWCTPNAGQLIFSCNNHDQTTRVDLATNGYFFRQGGGANYGWVSLDGMAWSPGGGNEISLYNGWNHYYSGYRTARYQRIGKVCVLSGLIRSGNWDGHITTLPSGCRPRKRIIFGVNNQDRMCRVDVLPGGEVYYISMRIGYDWLPLDGIKFIAHQ